MSLEIPAFVRQHVNEKGNPKAAYPNQAIAHDAAVWVEHMCGNGKRYPYRCSLCGQFHLAKNPSGMPQPEVPWYGEEATS